MPDPILVLQLQRLGDLILTFPLFEKLRASHPANPIIVAAEKNFYDGLEKLSPPVHYYPAEKIGALKGARFEMVVNLSHRDAAAACAASVSAPLKLGKTSVDSPRINGFWQLYRANLTWNNRHNTFHWADLNGLDSQGPIPRYAPIATPRAGSRRVGLVVGASDPSKRPSASFWARLGQSLAREGYAPFFLGGAGEKEIGAEAARLARLPGSNLCGKYALPELAGLMQGLALCITPDTGPMHLASLAGAPVLNLSMGPVNAWETGPAREGQWILRAASSCVGCWECRREKFFCKDNFTPGKVARIAFALLRGEEPPQTPGLELLQVISDRDGLLNLRPTRETPPPGAESARGVLEYFWRAMFPAFIDSARISDARRAGAELVCRFPALAEKMRLNAAAMLTRSLKSFRASALHEDADTWREQPLHSRIFAGHCRLWLENENFSGAAKSEIIRRQELLLQALSD